MQDEECKPLEAVNINDSERNDQKDESAALAAAWGSGIASVDGWGLDDEQFQPSKAELKRQARLPTRSNMHSNSGRPKAAYR